MDKDSFNEFLNAAEKSDNSKLRRIGENAASKLSREQKETVDRALSDPDFLKSLLSSETAQNIMKKLKGEK